MKPINHEQLVKTLFTEMAEIAVERLEEMMGEELPFGIEDAFIKAGMAVDTAKTEAEEKAALEAQDDALNTALELFRKRLGI
jgi:replication initiation and membrane attachment protein DnaB